MQFYHWLPGFRFYMVVKSSYDATDVEAIFRVNSISSFTLGVFQLVGIMATFVTKRPITLYVQINIVTQCLNWLLTILYFTSPVSRWMAVASHAKQLSRHYTGMLAQFATENARTTAMAMNGMDLEAAKHKAEETKRNIAKLLEHRFMGFMLAERPPSPPRAPSPPRTPSTGTPGSADEKDFVGVAPTDGCHEMVVDQIQNPARVHCWVEEDEKKRKEQEYRQQFLRDLEQMREIDVKDFLILLRNQEMATIDVSGGL